MLLIRQTLSSQIKVKRSKFIQGKKRLTSGWCVLRAVLRYNARGLTSQIARSIYLNFVIWYILMWNICSPIQVLYCANANPLWPWPAILLVTWLPMEFLFVMARIIFSRLQLSFPPVYFLVSFLLTVFRSTAQSFLTFNLNISCDQHYALPSPHLLSERANARNVSCDSILWACAHSIL